MDEKNKVFMPEVLGLKRVKEELALILSWYKNPEAMGERKELLPHGLLFFGAPGYGKTLLTREYSKLFDCPVFEVEGNSDNIQKEVTEVYTKASAEPFAIVVIDELDKLVRHDSKLTRILQSQLDGFRKMPNVLTLATANERYDIPEPLLREGRFDRQFDIDSSSREDTEEAVRGFLKLAHLSFGEDAIAEIVDEFRYDSPIHIRASINAAVLRSGSSCTAEDIIGCSYFAHHGVMPKKEELDINDHLAIHEAGHAAYLHFFARSMGYGRIYFTKDGGGCTSVQRMDNTPSLDGAIEQIRCALAGLIAEELLLGNHEYGCHDDLDKAHDRAYKLVNMEGLKSAGHHCIHANRIDLSKYSSQAQMHRFDIAANKFVAKQYRKTKKQMRLIKKNILCLAEFLKTNKKASKQDIARLLGPAA